MSYSFGFSVGDDIPGREFYEISTFYPQMENYYGILTGLAYTVPYMITGLVMGAVTSRVNRVKAYAASLVLGGVS